MWPFKKKPAPPRDRRNWNEDWQVGDTAECIIEPTSSSWEGDIKPWERPAFGQQFTVVGFNEGIIDGTNVIAYFLLLEGWPIGITTTAFRKVRSVKQEESEVVQRILKAKPGADKVREDV